jgi:hypothetical protein
MSRLTDQMDQSATWLADQRDHDSGGWGAEPGSPELSTMNTAEAVIALIDADADAIDSDAVKDGLRFLRAKQRATDPDIGAWSRETTHEGTPIANADVVRTGLALEAFVRARVRVDDPAITNGVEWLLGRQNDDGGWGLNAGSQTRLLQTCAALLGLLAVFEARGAKPTDAKLHASLLSDRVGKGVTYLTGTAQRAPGFFSSSPVADLLAAPHTIHATLVLQVARRLGLITDANAEHKAIDWLLVSQDAARRLAVEEVELDPDNRYPFLHVTDTLLIRVLSNSDRKDDRESLLFRAALYSVKDRIEPDRGACYGYHVFTWSTARAVTAISAASTVTDDFPDRPAEFHGTKTGPLLTGVMILFLAAAAVLGFTGHFSTEVAGFFALVLLAILLINQKIGEKTFAQLVQARSGAPAPAAKP